MIANTHCLMIIAAGPPPPPPLATKEEEYLLLPLRACFPSALKRQTEPLRQTLLERGIAASKAGEERGGESGGGKCGDVVNLRLGAFGGLGSFTC
jgi:hypothetical protein